MKYPDRVQEIINQLAGLHPDLVQGDDEARRTLTGYVASQVCWEFGPLWGRKSSTPTNPVSVDTIAMQHPQLGLICWDFQISGGVIAQFPDHIEINNQNFIPVTPINILAVPIGEIPPTDPGPNPDVEEIMERLTNIEKQLDVVLSMLQNPPNYAGVAKLPYLGNAPIVLKPTAN